MRYKGVAQILRYNWTMYLWSSVAITALLSIRSIFAIPILWWAIASLVASHFTYDRSGLFEFHWLDAMVPPESKRVLVLHAGLDESSEALSRRFVTICMDFYDPVVMTEASIRRVRTERSVRSADWQSLPIRPASLDAVFLMFAAHELRAARSRQKLLQEVRTALSSTGRLVLVEHLRNATNFSVFGPGVLHFFSRSSWLSDTAAAGLSILAERKLNWFARAMVFEPGG